MWSIHANLLSNTLCFLFLLTSDAATIHFDTHTISKPDSVSALTELDDDAGDEGHEMPSQQTFDRIVREFRQKLGLSLFGIDVIVEKGSARHAIIDMNVFPGLLMHEFIARGVMFY